jgi:putative SOS response-associated peptidase YedK
MPRITAVKAVWIPGDVQIKEKSTWFRYQGGIALIEHVGLKLQDWDESDRIVTSVLTRDARPLIARVHNREPVEVLELLTNKSK